MALEKRITQRDIARRVGLSISAVSFAMRDQPGVSSRTKMRVKRAAEAMGYKPDPVLSALVAYRTRNRIHTDLSVVALVSNWTAKTEWTARPSAKELMAGAERRARELGYSLQHFWAREKGMTGRRLGEVLLARGIRGVILAPLEEVTDRLDLDWSQFSVVTVEQPAHYANFHHVVPNYSDSMLMAWERLRDRGYRKIGVVVRASLAVRGAHQWEAVHWYVQAGIALADRIPALVIDAHDDPGETIARWLRLHRPDAVICRCEGFFEAARQEGLRVPADIGYASLNIVDDEPDVSGVDQHRGTMGEIAMDVINGLLQRNQRGVHAVPRGTLVSGTWHEGTTLRPAPGVRTARKARRSAAT